jgi:hypothetical protein
MVFSNFFDKARGAQTPGESPRHSKEQGDVKHQAAKSNKKRTNKKTIDKRHDIDNKKGETTKYSGKRQSSFRAEEKSKKVRPSKKRRSQPSEDALKLSERLKDLSRNKNLDEALKIYWSKSNDLIRDEFHACIIVDCCARCGNISVGWHSCHG